jgi:hypothetical protein
MSIFVAALIGTVGVAVLAGLLLIVVQPPAPWTERLTVTLILFVVLVAGLAGAVAVACRRRVLAAPAAAAALVSAAGTALAMFTACFADELGYRNEELLYRLASTGMTLGLVFVHGGLMSLVPARTMLLHVGRGLTVAAALLTAAGVLTLAWLDVLGWGDWILVVGATALLALAGLVGTIAVPVGALSEANRRKPPEETIAAAAPVHLACPRCGHRQHLRAGPRRCLRCRAVIVIEIEEPRCACGYPIYRLADDRCPECGRSLATGTPPQPPGALFRPEGPGNHGHVLSRGPGAVH